MKRQFLSSVLLVALAAAVIPSAFVLAQTGAPAPAKPSTAATAAKPPTAAKSAKAWTLTKTPWGDPDLQGVWNDATSTPLQRPAGKGEAVLDE